MVKKRGKPEKETATPSSMPSDAAILESRVLQQKFDRAHTASRLHKIAVLVLGWELLHSSEASASIADLAVVPSMASFLVLVMFLPKVWPLWRSMWFVVIAAFFFCQAMAMSGILLRGMMGGFGLMTLVVTPPRGEHQRTTSTTSAEFAARIAIILHVCGVTFFCWQNYSSHSTHVLLTLASLLFVAILGSGQELVAAIFAGIVFVTCMVIQCVFTDVVGAYNLVILLVLIAGMYASLFLPILSPDPRTNPFYGYAFRSCTQLKKLLSNPSKGFGDDD
eukprot:GEMP01074505.1.p1 GENE.GEMP01074505.1~~GEMP01074505.1.p1  ORF type:complete len:295 (+),score=45.82 GEMP01074505.1:53-886(+)